jgi:hypothetical protein
MVSTWTIIGMMGIVMLMSVEAQKEDLSFIINEPKMEIEEMKSEMRETKDINIRNIETEQRLLHTEHEIRMNKEELERIKFNMEMMKEDQKQNLNVIKQLESEVSILKDPPFTFACGSHQASFTKSAQIIPYSKLLYASSNVDGAGLDIDTGVFTAGHPGSYTVTWSLAAANEADEYWVAIHLRKNGVRIEESEHESHYTGTSGVVLEQGGRTFVIHLERGDTVDLYCRRCEAGINFTTFCVSLSQFDVI